MGIMDAMDGMDTMDGMPAMDGWCGVPAKHVLGVL
jgi:hypothetical protein